MLPSSTLLRLRNVFLILATSLSLGCSALSGTNLMAERYLACPMDSVWSSSLETLKAYPVTVKDKTQGRIETGWRVGYVEGRGYGLLQHSATKNRMYAKIDPARNQIVFGKMTAGGLFFFLRHL